VDEIGHYPPADFEPAISHLASFLWPGKEEGGREGGRDGCKIVVASSFSDGVYDGV